MELFFYFFGNTGARNTSLALATLKSWEHFAGLSGTGNVTLTKLKVTGKFIQYRFFIEFPFEQRPFDSFILSFTSGL